MTLWSYRLHPFLLLRGICLISREVRIVQKKIEKWFPSEYKAFKKGRGRRQETYYVRDSEKSCVFANVQKVAVDAMFSELRSRKSISRLCLYENAENCVVDFGDVAVDGALGRYCITKKLTGEFAEYLLTLYLYHEGTMFRLIASGEEKGNSSLRRFGPERAYRKISAEAFGSETIVAGVGLIDDMPREGCCYRLGEDPFYDDLYPEHPLTQLRLLAKSLVYKASAKGAA